MGCKNSLFGPLAFEMIIYLSRFNNNLILHMCTHNLIKYNIYFSAYYMHNSIFCPLIPEQMKRKLQLALKRHVIFDMFPKIFKRFAIPSLSNVSISFLF